MCAILAFLFRVSLAKGMYLMLFAVDVLMYSITSFLLGLYGSWGAAAIVSVFILGGALFVRQYFSWRKERRILWLHRGEDGLFLLPWMRYADLCADTLHPRLCVAYLILFVFGKLCVFL